MPSDPLTREQFERQLSAAIDFGLEDTWRHEELLASDAALRAQLEAEEQASFDLMVSRDAAWKEIAELKQEVRRLLERLKELEASDKVMADRVNRAGHQIDDLEQQLATTTERLKAEEQASFDLTVSRDAAWKEIRELKERLTVVNKALLTSCSDHREYLECQPTCDSYGHDEKCEVANPGLAFHQLETQLKVAEERVRLAAVVNRAFAQSEQNLADDLAARTQELTQAHSVQAGLMRDVTSLSEQLAAREERVKELESCYDSSRTLYSKVLGQLHAAQDRLGILEVALCAIRDNTLLDAEPPELRAQNECNLRYAQQALSPAIEKGHE